MKFIYNCFIFLYHCSIRFVSPFNVKAKQWVEGRKNIFETITASLNQNSSQLIWVHCASLGEFEQGRPLIEKIKSATDYKILLTFFSPSGYEARKNYSSADYIFYLPIDTHSNAFKFIRIVKPSMAFFLKYEFWFNYLNELRSNEIPTYLVSGVFREEHYFFKNYGLWFRNQLRAFTYFFLQDQSSMQLLNSIGYINCIIAGDTRFDRVLAISKNVKEIQLVKKFCENNNVFIAGSTWLEDEQLLSQSNAIENYKLIIAPHEIDKKHIESVCFLFKNEKVVKFSEANLETIAKATVLIIDNIGMLSALYQYGTIAYVGGGFGKGIHNILEAATFGLPIIIGPNYAKFSEAKQLINNGGAFEISNINELALTLKKFENKETLQTTGRISKKFVNDNSGATEKIFSFVFK